jgi:hypothetical protein
MGGVILQFGFIITNTSNFSKIIVLCCFAAVVCVVPVDSTCSVPCKTVLSWWSRPSIIPHHKSWKMPSTKKSVAISVNRWKWNWVVWAICWGLILTEFDKSTKFCHSRYFSHCAMTLKQIWDCMSIHIFSWMTGIRFVWELWTSLLFSGWNRYVSSIGTLTSEVKINKYLTCYLT